MTELVILSAIEQLEGLLGEEAAPMQGAVEQLEGLKTDLTMMLNFLRESAGRPNRNHLISKVKEMAGDTQVILDNFIFTAREKLEWEPNSISNFLRAIESIRSRIRKVNLQSPVEEEEDDEDFPQDNVTLGLEELESKVLRDQIFLEIKRLYGFMLVGMGGIGKTTLARKLYNNSAIELFDCRGWACVSGEIRLDEVFRSLLREVGSIEEEKLNQMDLESLQEMLYQDLYSKRYFIVLDDVWDDTCVNHVLRSLPRNETSSRVLLTGRSSNTDYIVQDLDSLVNMNHLDSNTSWQLFLKTVFNSYDKCPNHLEKIGRKIVTKCNGLPFAIKEAGKQLARLSQSESVWEEFLESMDLTATTGKLEMSYHRLSPKLKSYFLHMSFFREGTIIRVKKFMHILNAAIMVERSEVCDNQTTEETTRMFLEKLSRESLIIKVDYSIEEKLKSFCLDGFLHNISITKAVEEINFEILGNQEIHRPTCKSRHLAIYCSRDRFNYSTNQDKDLVSLFFHGGGSFDATPSYWENFERLQILDFEGFGLKSLPETVSGLGGLRYLGLRDNYLQELPRTLGRLKNLEVLDVALNFKVEVADIIWEMDSLRHLYMSDIICRTPLKIDSLRNLQTLTYISVDNWRYELSSLEMMTSLNKLGIEKLKENSDVSRLFTSLAKLKSLQCLILRGFHFRSMPPLDDLTLLDGLTQLRLDGRLTRLPEFPQNISCLTLINSCLDKDPMPELEKLPSLRYLKLRNAFICEEMIITEDGFEALEILCIEELWNLRTFEFEFGGMRILKRLEISSCPYLETFPEDFECFNADEFKMVTTKNIAKKVRDFNFEIAHVDIQPYE